MCVYVCMRVCECLHAHLDVRMGACVSTNVWMHANVHLCMDGYLNACTNGWMYLMSLNARYVRMHVCLQAEIAVGCTGSVCR
jgi:hypothetical protein